MLHELWELNRNLGHWLFEAEGAIIGVVWHALWVRRHDRLKHSKTCSRCSEGHTYIGDCELRIEAQERPVAEQDRYTDIGAPRRREAASWLSGPESRVVVCSDETPCDRCVAEGYTPNVYKIGPVVAVPPELLEDG